MSYYPALDGLRLVCCLWVIAGHGFVYHPLGHYLGRLANAGVQVFFALSGFVIATSLLRERSRTGRIGLADFYRRRIRRIFPVYFAAVFLGLGGLLLLGERFARPFGTSLAQVDLTALFWTHVTFTANWFKLAGPTCLDVLWSISVEEQFYLVFPLLLILAGPRWPVVLGLALAWVARAWLALHDPLGIYRNTLALADYLLLGVLLAVVSSRVPRVNTVGQLLPFAAVLLLAAWEPSQPAAVWVWGTLSAVSCTLVVAGLAFGEGALGRALSRPGPRRLGQLTYACYVFHMYGLVVAWALVARLTADVIWAAPLRTALGAVLAFALAELSRRTLERRW